MIGPSYSPFLFFGGPITTKQNYLPKRLVAIVSMMMSFLKIWLASVLVQEVDQDYGVYLYVPGKILFVWRLGCKDYCHGGQEVDGRETDASHPSIPAIHPLKQQYGSVYTRRILQTFKFAGRQSWSSHPTTIGFTKTRACDLSRFIFHFHSFQYLPRDTLYTVLVFRTGELTHTLLWYKRGLIERLLWNEFV
jgi:hypothetical protein